MEILPLVSKLITIQIVLLENDLRLLHTCTDEHFRKEFIRRKIKSIQELLHLLEEIQESLIKSTQFEIDTLLGESAHSVELLTKNKALSPNFQDLLEEATASHAERTITLTEKEEELIVVIEKEIKVLKTGLVSILGRFQNYPI